MHLEKNKLLLLTILFFTVGCPSQLQQAIQQLPEKTIKAEPYQEPSPTKTLPKSVFDSLMEPKTSIPSIGVAAVGGGVLYYLFHQGQKLYAHQYYLDVTVQNEIQRHLNLHSPTHERVEKPKKQTASGVFFISDESKEKLFVVKPMVLEPLPISVGKETLRGQGVANSIFAYELDQALGGFAQIPRTVVVKLKYSALNPGLAKTRERYQKIPFSNIIWQDREEIASAQEYVKDSDTLSHIFVEPCTKSFTQYYKQTECIDNEFQKAAISKQEYDKLSILFLTGETDGNYSNFLYNKTLKRFYIIDSAYSFLKLSKNNANNINIPAMRLYFSSEPMEKKTYQFLSDINVDQVMHVMEQKASQLKAIHPVFAFSRNRLNALRLRLELAKIVGLSGNDVHPITQAEWYAVLTASANKEHANFYKSLFFQYIHNKPSFLIPWQIIRTKLEQAFPQAQVELIQDFFSNTNFAYQVKLLNTIYDVNYFFEEEFLKETQKLLGQLLSNPFWKANPNMALDTTETNLGAQDTALHVAIRLGLDTIIDRFFQIPNLDCKTINYNTQTPLDIAKADFSLRHLDAHQKIINFLEKQRNCQ